MTPTSAVGTHPPADLSMNETPYPPLPGIRRIVADGAAALQRYPDRTSSALVSALTARLGVGPEGILVGPGSAGLCQHLVQSLGPRPEVVHAALSFEGYPLIIGNAGARAVPVPMDGYGHDLPAMADAVTERTRCVLLCNPNNPTGAALRRDEVRAFLDRIPADVPVIVDEAYREFVTDPDAPDGMELYRAYDNVCVLRTFSKAYGLAALRIGYAVVPPRLTRAAALTGAVFFPNALAQAAAVASLSPDVTPELTRRCTELVAARTRLIGALRGLGVTVAPSEANFVWLPLGEGAVSFADRARAAGILVMALPGAGVRITVGSDEANDRLLAFVRAALAEGL
ncbi:aminotransferase class I/II-fold pyridoxal phosphate-dependent enzyme [Micromonospora robiginosa]|uniref:Aminotransferase class I/II-fold pyridoxal phosphate-dependent enzyme n=1 Tax=Micromonospora robiginosa TaxID=2749844 RepID=A0A7L6BEY7_9ACTN|nr:aminotransferase class I/II-fold pyridoxal phosphate-dependent enzyme [Micromonospora ferruginea]QLQ40506.2 aminotransferase class I/II-fold pyridoxal phosphate-dependent enzyme [Micromonospora ferruginea]